MKQREQNKEREREKLLLCAHFWVLDLFLIVNYITAVSVFVAAFDLRVCLQLLSSQALTMSPIVGRRESLGFFMRSCTKWWWKSVFSKVPRWAWATDFQRHWAVSPWVQRFILFLAKILPLGDIKNREGLPPLYRGFLGEKKKKTPKFRHISRKKVMSLPYLDFRSLPVHSRVSKKKNLLVFLSSVARFG
jgi:hypothetical protein